MRAGPIGRLSIERVFLRPDRPLPVTDALRLTGRASSHATDGLPADDVNALHPFREGNGRAQRAHDAGHHIAWVRMDPDRNRSKPPRTCPSAVQKPGSDQITNTPQNTRVRLPASCYSYCMISPIRGNFTGFGVQVPPRTHGG
jgi:hypothetical protein